MGSRTVVRVVAGLALVGSILAVQQIIAPATKAGAEIPAVGNVSANSYAGLGVAPFGNAVYHGGPSDLVLRSIVTSMAATSDGGGYWLAAADGGVFTYGDAPFYGSAGDLHLNAPIVGIAATPDNKGYWLVGADGGIFTYGDAGFYGSMGGHRLAQPVVGIAATKDGKGYWLVASDGGVFTFGDAAFYGSMGGRHLNAPVVGITATVNGKGYWLGAADGGVFTFGDAPFHGSLGAESIYNSITGIAASNNGNGYWMVGGGGEVYGFGEAVYGTLAGRVPAVPTAAITSTPNGNGYWLLAPQDFRYSLVGSPYPGRSPYSSAIVNAAVSQVGGDPDLSQGAFCNPYGPCEEWCSLFATWTWNAAGVGIPRYPFVGSVYDWGAARGLDIPGYDLPAPGDAIEYGTGPENTLTAPHIGIVAEVWPDGEVITVEGDAGPGKIGQLNVVINGPFLPEFSQGYNGFPVFAYVQPPA